MRLHDFLDYRARERGDAEYAIHGDRRISYREALAETNRLANAIVGAGLQIGDRVAVLSKNSIEFVLLYLAASKAGVVIVPLNYRLAPPEWAWIANDAEAKLLLARREFVAAIDPMRGELPKVEHWLAQGVSAPGWDDWDAWLAEPPETPPRREIGPHHELYQMYTSGTTGRPKGAVLTQQAVCHNLVQASQQFGLTAGERALIVAPYYHAAAAITSFCTVLAGGSLFIQEEFDPRAVVRALAEERVVLALLVPAMIQFCLVAVPDAAERSYPTLRVVVYGASAIAEHTLRHRIEEMLSRLTSTLSEVKLRSEVVISRTSRSNTTSSIGRRS